MIHKEDMGEIRKLTRRPYVPDQVNGLFEALRSYANGDDGRIENWNRNGRPCLVRALHRWGLSLDLAEDITQDTILAAFEIMDRSDEIEKETAFLSGVVSIIAKHNISKYTNCARYTISDKSHPSYTTKPIDILVFKEDRRRAASTLRSSIRRLPEPYRKICLLQYVHHRSRAEVVYYLRDRDHRGLSDSGARYLLRTAHRMLFQVLRGADPRIVWPGRFSKKNPWFSTPPHYPHYLPVHAFGVKE